MNNTDLVELFLVLVNEVLIDRHLRWRESGRSGEFERGIARRIVSDIRRCYAELITNPTSFLASQRNGFSKL